MKKILILLLGLLTLGTAGACCVASADSAVLVKVGIYENRPKIFTDEQGVPSGFWPDIIDYIAAQERWDIKYVRGTWTQCLDKLKNNEIDIMPDVAYSEEREELFDFSNETVYVSWSRVYAPQGSVIRTIPDLEGKSIAVLKDSINVEGPDGIKKLTASFDIDCTFIETDSYLKVFELLDSRQADAGVVSKDFAYLHENSFHVVHTDIVFQPARLYFAFPEESLLKPFLIERIDYHVGQLKASGDSIYYQSVAKWLGVTPIEKPVFPGYAMWTLIGIAGLALLFGAGSGILKYQVERKTKALSAEIAERYRTEKGLRESEEKYRVTLDSMMEGCQIIDFNYRYIYLNDTAIRHSQRTREELIGRTMMELYPGVEQTEMFANLRRCMEYRMTHQMENLFTYPDGSQRWFELSIEPVPEGVFVLSIDITERKKAEQALRESEEKLERIFQAVPEGIVISTLDGVIIGANRALVKMHGYKSKEEIIGKKAADFVAEKERESVKQFVRDTLEKGVIMNLSATLLKKDGTEFPGEYSNAVLKDAAGNPVGIVSVSADVTARMQAKEEHQKNIEYRELDRLKTNLLSTISHELRTPLASIKGYASMLLLYSRRLDVKQKNESIQAIDRATDRLTELIDHLLDMSRLDAGLLKLTLQPVKIPEILTAAVKEAKLRAPGYDFNLDIKEGAPDAAADVRRLRQIIDNILDNAVKYSPEGTEITMRLEIKPQELLISITDQGRGIPESEYKQIFERMYRIEQRLKKDPGGLGLGLSLCKALVEAHGGRIWVESKIGKGSTFYFTIPLKNIAKGNKDGSEDRTKANTRDRG